MVPQPSLSSSRHPPLHSLFLSFLLLLCDQSQSFTTTTTSSITSSFVAARAVSFQRYDGASSVVSPSSYHCATQRDMSRSTAAPSDSSVTEMKNYDDETLAQTWADYLSPYSNADCEHIYGCSVNDDGTRHHAKLSKLQSITALRLRDLADTTPSPPSTPFSTQSLWDKITSTHPAMALAAEFKRASPSKGDINPHLNPAEQATAYTRAGASIISILTETRHFKGSLSDLTAVRRATEDLRGVQRPVILLKDFVVRREQIRAAKEAGADTILLIVAVLPRGLLRDLVGFARELGMEPLVEVHSLLELSAAIEADARVMGVNNRNLHTFELDLATTDVTMEELRKRGVKLVSDGATEDGVVVGALSGISSSADVERYRALGVQMVLVGESLMRSPDPEAAIQGLGLDPNAAPVSTTTAGGSYTGGTKLIKVCGVTTAEDALVACRAGANLIGVIFAEKSKRKVSTDQARDVVTAVRRFGERSSAVSFPPPPSSSSPLASIAAQSRMLESVAQHRPLVVGVFQNQSPEFIASMVQEAGLDLVQLHGREGCAAAARELCGGVPAIRVMDLPPATSDSSVTPLEDMLSSLTHDPMAILLDTAIKDGAGGGTGQKFDWSLASQVQDRGLPVIIAGGLTPENVGEAVGSVRPWGVDVSSGVEESPGMKDHGKVRDYVGTARRVAVEANKGI